MRTGVTLALFVCHAAVFAQSPDNEAEFVQRRLDAGLVAADLNRFEQILEEQWLLSNLNEVDFRSAIESARQRLRRGATVGELAVEMQRIVCLGADGHAAAEFFQPELRRRSRHFPPFTVVPVGDRYVAIQPSSRRLRQLFRPNYPYVVEIDGIPIERWIEATMPYVCQSHSLAMRARAADWLCYAGAFRQQLGIPDAPEFALQLESEDGLRRVEKFAARDVPPAYGAAYRWFRNFLARQATGIPQEKFSMSEHGFWRVTDENIGYIQLNMAAGRSGLARVRAMAHLRQTDGLVLDLRSNMGGHGFDLLYAWGLWLLDPRTPRHVAFVDRRWKWNSPSIAHPGYRESSPELSTVGRHFVKQFLAQYRTSWSPPSHRAREDWVCLLSRPVDEPLVGWFPMLIPQYIGPDEPYHYDRPVIVLCDRYTFSAAEILVAGLQSLPNVRVLGEPTRGGAASPDGHRLPSGQRVQLGSECIILQRDGSPIDGVGVTPDIAVPLDLATLSGERDTMLQRAIEQLVSEKSR